MFLRFSLVFLKKTKEKKDRVETLFQILVVSCAGRNVPHCEPHFLAGNCSFCTRSKSFLQENAVSDGKPIFLQFPQGLRIMNGISFHQKARMNYLATPRNFGPKHGIILC